MYFSTLPWLKKKKIKTKHTKPQTNITVAALNIRLQMPFRFISPADEAFWFQKFFSDSENNAFFASVFFL